MSIKQTLSSYLQNSLLLVLLISIMLLMGCKEKKHHTEATQETFLVKQDHLSETFYYNGTIRPITVSSIASPINGIVTKQFFTYGQKLSAGQKLFVIESDDLEQDFITSVGDYIKAIDDYEEKKRAYLGAEELKHLQFISQNDYESDKNTYQQAYFSKQKARYKLQQLLKKMDIKDDIDSMDLKNPKLIDHMLENNHNNLVIKAPQDGIALIPNLDSDKGDEKVQQGNEVKQGQVLLTLGNFSGITLTIDVSQTDIQHLQLNQEAAISSSAFPEHVLKGHINHIDQQAHSDGHTAPTFTATVIVPELTLQEKQAIHIGMNAKVTIQSETNDVISIPLAAVQRDMNRTWVMVLDKDNIPRESLVTLGKTTLDKVIIKQGLAPGDTVVYQNKSPLPIIDASANAFKPITHRNIVVMNH